MEPFYQRSGISIFHGDCRDILAALEPASVQCCVTSPPYWGLRDYGIPPSVWGGAPECEHEWGDSVAVSATNHVDKRRWNHARNGRGEDQPTEKLPGWKRQTIEQGKFCQHCNAWSGNLGLEPTPELFVSHIVEVFEAVWRVLRDDGTLWLNLGDSYSSSGMGGNPAESAFLKQASNAGSLIAGRSAPPGMKPKDLVGIPWAVAFALRSAGWYLRSDIIWAKPNPMPESVTDRPTKAHEYIFLMAKSDRYHYDADAIREPMLDSSVERFKYAFKGDPFTNANGVEAHHGKGYMRSDEPHEPNPGGRNKRSVWTVANKPVKEAHFATFPPKLIEPAILAGCPEGGTVLDPFTGSGTTAIVCKNLGRKFVGCELNEDYIAIAEKRIGRQEVLF